MSVTLFLAAAAATAQPTAVPVNSESVEQIEVAYDALAEGRNQAAIEQMRNSDLVKAGDPAALINLGTAYARLGMIEEARESFDAAAAHLEKQLRRYKRRLKDHHSARREPVRQLEAASYVISPAPEEEDETAGLNPVVVAETGTNVPEISVGEAVMQLDISNVPFVLFRNGGHGRLNVVYRRPDGNIGWVDPKPEA